MKPAAWCGVVWLLQGIWEAEMDGTDVNALDKAKGIDVLVTADDRGKARLTEAERERAAAPPSRL